MAAPPEPHQKIPSSHRQQRSLLRRSRCASFLEILTAFLTMDKQLERYAWFMAENDIRSLGIFVGILEALQANGTEISTYALNSFIDQLQSLKNDFEEILLKQEKKDDNL
jgi:hypothetical protein